MTTLIISTDGNSQPAYHKQHASPLHAVMHTEIDTSTVDEINWLKHARELIPKRFENMCVDEKEWYNTMVLQ